MLSHLPEITIPSGHLTFWGEYRWSSENTHQFEHCARLHETARGSQSMTEAFSNLSKASELAISVVGGLGWLSGPDVSERARFFKMKPPVFEGKNPLQDAQARDRMESWMAICEARGKHVNPPLRRR